jgi:Tfp pilus assembly protein PilF
MAPVHLAATVLLILAIAAAGCALDPDTEKRKALQRATEFVAKNDLTNAIIEYRRAIRIDPQFGETRDKLAQAYLESGDARNALAQN